MLHAWAKMAQDHGKILSELLIICVMLDKDVEQLNSVELVYITELFGTIIIRLIGGEGRKLL